MSTEEQKVIIEEVTEETPSTNETVTITEPKVREPSPFKNYFDKMNKKMSKYKRQESKQNITPEEKEEVQDKIKCIDNMRFILKLNTKELKTINRVLDFIKYDNKIETIQQDICKTIDEEKI